MIVFFLFVIIRIISVRLAADAIRRTNGVPKIIKQNITGFLSVGLTLWQYAGLQNL